MTLTEKQSHPKIKSFILRQGRATTGQRIALATNWDNYCLDPAIDYDFSKVFAKQGPLVVEIGFGNGSGLAELAKANPDINYLGIEVHRPGIGHLMLLLEREGIQNVRIFHHDAIDILEQKIADASLAGVHLFFPDPWQKRRHHKRRIVRPEFIRLLVKKLQSDGYFHAATDWEHYAKDMLSLLSASEALINVSDDGAYCNRPDYRPLTKFESRGIRLGHGVWDLIFKKREIGIFL